MNGCAFVIKIYKLSSLQSWKTLFALFMNVYGKSGLYLNNLSMTFHSEPRAFGWIRLILKAGISFSMKISEITQKYFHIEKF